MAGYQTTYSAGMSKMETAGNHDPADATSEPWDPATDPDTGHDSAADKPHDERVPWEVVPPTEDPAQETEPLTDPATEGTMVDPFAPQPYTPPVVEGGQP